MRILALETSCDETSIAIVEDGRRVMSNVIASSVQAFTSTGGVIPEEAARQQVHFVLPVLHQAFEKANMGKDDLDAIAVTRGPGLLGSLLVGTVTARILGRLWHKPIIPVHHTLGHLSSPWLETEPEDAPAFPLLTLSASGGHTDLWLRTSHTKGQLLGRSRDDASGEAFDKGAQLLGLSYPGGPAISQAGEHGNPAAFPFPLPLSKEDTLDFSFSGLKTALRYTIRDIQATHDHHSPSTSTLPIADLAASYETAIIAHLVDRIERALTSLPHVREVHVAGGVSANTRLRSTLSNLLPDIRIRFPSKIHYCTDNAAMIASAAFFLVQEQGDKAFASFETQASLPLEEATQH